VVSRKKRNITDKQFWLKQEIWIRLARTSNAFSDEMKR